MKNVSVAVLVAGLLIATCSCATEPPSRKSDLTAAPSADRIPTPAASEREKAEFAEVQALFSRGLYETLFPKLSGFEKRYPNSPLMPQVRNLHGLAFLMSKKPAAAVFHFKKSLETNSNPAFAPFVQYNLATALFENNQLEESLQVLHDIQPDQLDKDNRTKYHALRARLFQKTGAHREAAREFLTVSRLLADLDGRAPFASQLETSLREIVDVRILESLYKDFEDAPLVDLVLFRLGQQELAQNRTAAAETHLRTLLARYPKSIHYSDAAELIANLGPKNTADPAVVGLLLPTKGKFARYGAQALQAIELAFRIFNTEEPDSKISLVIQDSGEDADQALQGLNELYLKHHVVAVIGPLTSKGIDSVTQRAEELGLPLITLSQQSGQPGDFVFAGGMTIQMQAQSVAQFAVQNLGLKRFAILHPRDKFGEQYSQTYWDAVDHLGATVVGIESYNPGETDFRQPIDKLSGLYYTESRQRELDELAQARQRDNIKKRNRRTEQYYSLKPIVDYDAVFIPDDARVAGQILPTFAYRDVEKVRFLGIASWDSPDLVSRAQASAEGAIFVDALSPEPRSSVTLKFLQSYRAMFGQDPGSIEAMAYDAGELLRHVLSRGANSRAEVRDELKAVTRFNGVTGRISYKDGQLARELPVLTVKAGKIQDASATATSNQ